MLLTNKNFSLDILNQAIDVQCFSDSFWCLPEENNILQSVYPARSASDLVWSDCRDWFLNWWSLQLTAACPQSSSPLRQLQLWWQSRNPPRRYGLVHSRERGSLQCLASPRCHPHPAPSNHRKVFLNNAMNQASERNKIFRSVKSVNYNFTDRRIILSSVLRSETQLTWQATSSEKLQLETISCIFPSFITTTAGRTLSPSSTLVLLTALTVDPSSMFLFYWLLLSWVP